MAKFDDLSVTANGETHTLESVVAKLHAQAKATGQPIKPERALQAVVSGGLAILQVESMASKADPAGSDPVFDAQLALLWRSTMLRLAGVLLSVVVQPEPAEGPVTERVGFPAPGGGA